MSETGRKLDVEDVLSSIRRLVSEEARGDGASANSTEAPEKPAPEKLVLTPSLRVPEDDKPVATSEIERRISDIETLVNADARETLAAPMPPTDTTEMISALGQSMRDFEPEDQTAFMEPAIEEDVETDEHPDGVEDPIADSWTDTPDADDIVAVADDHSATDRGPIIEDFYDEDAMDFPADSPYERDVDEEVSTTRGFVGQQDVEAADVIEDAVLVTDEPEDDTESAPEVIPEDVVMAEDDLPPEPPLRAPSIERAEEPVEALVDMDPPESFPEQIDYTAGEDGAFIDEDMLREIVSEMVRSELQGELGDRITRNVRKLVRREIHRALASRDFE